MPEKRSFRSRNKDVTEITFVRFKLFSNTIVFFLYSLFSMTFNFFPGNVSEETAHVATINGVIDRGNKTWTFEDEFGSMFRASLLKGNMVNGTVYQPATDDTFSFIGIATD